MKYSFIINFIFFFSLNNRLILGLKSPLSEEDLEYCTTWGTSNVKTLSKNFPPIMLSNNSIRQIVRISIPGEKIRIKFSNKYGSNILKFKRVIISLSASHGTSEIVLESSKIITFEGKEKVSIGPGEEIYSDIIEYTLNSLSEVAITINFGIVPSELTGHGNSISYSFIEEGDKSNEFSFSNEYKTPHWYFIEAIEIVSNGLNKAIVCFGDSITEGVGSTINENNRWPDKLAEILQKNRITENLAIVNAGIGGNRICDQGLKRYEHDVLNVKGVKYILVLYGVNDLIHLNSTSSVIISAYQQIIELAHKKNLYIYAGTILPFGKLLTWDSYMEINRQEVNKWIRETKKENGGFDSYFDFDKYVRDYNNLTNLLEEYDSGDGLHPSYLGHEAIANSIDLDIFNKNI